MGHPSVVCGLLIGIIFNTLVGHQASLLYAAEATVSEKSADTLTSKRDLAALHEEFLKYRFGLFACFDMANYLDYGHTNGYEDPLLFNPTDLDCGQWADEAKAAHMNYAVLTVKNTGGWCLWDSKYTTMDIAQAKNFRDGKGDVVREFVDAFRARDIKIGLYYCFPGNFAKPGVAYQREVPKGKPNLLGLPPEGQDDRVGFLKKQLLELLDNYGPVQVLWIDQMGGVPEVGARWKEIKDYLNEKHPECLVIGNNSHDYNYTDVISHERPIKTVEQLAEGNTRPSEVSNSMYSTTWFWMKGLTKSVFTPQETVGYLDFCNRNHANYLYCVPINRSGKIEGLELEHIREVSRLLSDNDNKAAKSQEKQQ